MIIILNPVIISLNKRIKYDQKKKSHLCQNISKIGFFTCDRNITTIKYYYEIKHMFCLLLFITHISLALCQTRDMNANNVKAGIRNDKSL